MKLSRYVRCIEESNEFIIYNTVNHSIIQMPKEAICKGELLDVLDDDSISALREMGFLEDTDDSIANNISSFFLNSKKLFISIELNLSCNLRCPYCYQAGEHNGKNISVDDLKQLIVYIKKVYDLSPFEDLYVKILGGEPTLVWSRFDFIHQEVACACKELNVNYHLLVDTNGTLIEQLVTLDNYNSLLFTIPLTYQKCHDKVRFDSKGNGTYSRILTNINILKNKLPEAKIVLRYNVDQNNILYFKNFLLDIKSKLSFMPLVSVNYTAELNGSEQFENPLSYRDFIEWSSTQAIDDFIDTSFPVTVSPIISIEECQFRSKYSLKLFSDGTIGRCAMDFFKKERIHIADLVATLTTGNTFIEDKANQSLIAEKECMNCDYIFLCGGTNKLPCIKALDSNLCKDRVFSINLEQFLKRYIKAQNDGLDNHFVVFNDGESYR